MITVERFIAWRHSVVPRPPPQLHLNYLPPHSPDQPNTDQSTPERFVHCHPCTFTTLIVPSSFLGSAGAGSCRKWYSRCRVGMPESYMRTLVKQPTKYAKLSALGGGYFLPISQNNERRRRFFER